MPNENMSTIFLSLFGNTCQSTYTDWWWDIYSIKIYIFFDDNASLLFWLLEEEGFEELRWRECNSFLVLVDSLQSSLPLSLRSTVLYLASSVFSFIFSSRLLSLLFELTSLDLSYLHTLDDLALDPLSLRCLLDTISFVEILLIALLFEPSFLSQLLAEIFCPLLSSEASVAVLDELVAVIECSPTHFLSFSTHFLDLLVDLCHTTVLKPFFFFSSLSISSKEIRFDVFFLETIEVPSITQFNAPSFIQIHFIILTLSCSRHQTML